MNPRYQKLVLGVIALIGLCHAQPGWCQAGSAQTASLQTASPQPASVQPSSAEIASPQTTSAPAPSKATDGAATDAMNADADLLKPGIVVEEVTPGYGADRAGLQKGDVLLSWSRGDQSGKFETPFDFMWVDVEQRPRGEVTFVGLRGSEPCTWKVHDLRMGASTAPNLPEGLLSPPGAYESQARLALAESSIAQSRPWLRSWLLMSAGRSFAKAGQWNEARARFQEALKAPPETSSRLQTYLLARWGDAAFIQNAKTDAETSYSRALQMARETGSDLEIAYLLHALGMFEERFGNYRRALDYFDESLTIKQRLIPGEPEVANTLLRMATNSYLIGDLRSSGNYLEQSDLIDNAWGPESPLRPYIAYAKGAHASLRGNLAEAEDYFRQALSLASRRSDANFRAFLIGNLGGLQLYRHDLRRAILFYQRAVAISKATRVEDASTAYVLSSLGSAALQIGDLVEAEAYSRQALTMSRKVSAPGWMLAQSLNNLGELAETRGNRRLAERYYLQELHAVQENIPNTFQVSLTLQDLGHLAFAYGELRKAAAYHRKAALILEKQAPNSGAFADSLAALGEIAARKGQSVAAGQYYQRTLNVLDAQSNQLGGTQDVRAGFRAQHAKYYSDYADLLISQRKLSAAFDVLERSRARTLLETLATAQVSINKGADAALLGRERNLRAEIHAKSERRIRLLGEKQTKELAEQVKEVEKEVSGLLSQLQDVESELRASSPGYSALTQPQPLSAKQVQQQLLDPDTVLLEYSLGTDRSHVFAVTPTSLTAVALPRRAVIEKAARRVYDLLTARNHPVKGETPEQQLARWNKAEAEYPAAAAELSRMVLGPIASQLSGKSGEQLKPGQALRRARDHGKPKRLLIVADGALQYIPFALLPEPSGATTNSSAAPLVVKHEVVNLPSASVLAVLREQEKGRQPAAKAVAVIADPVFDARDLRLSAAARSRAPASEVAASLPPTRGSAEKNSKAGDFDFLDESTSAHLLTRSATDLGLSRDGQLSLPRLLYSRQEADAIRAVTPADGIKEAVDFDATRVVAMSPELRNYRIVHFATHGLLNSEHPELSGLVFSLVDANGQPQDGFLQLEDIYNLDLPADLVVLSACETGLGKEINGEGLIGLTRGFMYAGATRVVASLWNVSDVATAQLMAEFYRSMEKDHLPPAAALRAAQIHMWKQKRWASPYYWAAFQIQGEWK